MRDHITINVRCSAAGQKLLPFIIFGRSFLSSAYSTHSPENAVHAKSPNGYMDEELFLVCLNLIKNILILDEHGSHMSAKAIDICIENNMFYIVCLHIQLMCCNHLTLVYFVLLKMISQK